MLFKMDRYDFSKTGPIVRLVLMCIVLLFVLSFVYEEIQQMFAKNLEVTLYGLPKNTTADQVPTTKLWRRPFVYLTKLTKDGWELIHVANVCLNLTMMFFELQWLMDSRVQ